MADYASMFDSVDTTMKSAVQPPSTSSSSFLFPAMAQQLKFASINPSTSTSTSASVSANTNGSKVDKFKPVTANHTPMLPAPDKKLLVEEYKSYQGERARFILPYELDIDATTRHIKHRLKKFAIVLQETPASYELESRLIVRHSHSRKVSPDVPAPLFDRILNFFAQHFAHYHFTSWYSTHDSFFPDDVRLRKKWTNNGDSTSTSSDNGGDNSQQQQLPPEEPTKVEISWMRKTLVENSDWAIHGREFGMRVSLKLEKKITPPETITATTTPLMIQSKRTCCFRDKAVTIFFSVVWSGDNEFDAKHCKLPIRTIEVEVNNDEAMLLIRPEDVIYNLIVRTLDLQGVNAHLSLSELK